MSVRSVPFMELPTAPWILFGLLLFLGALNFQLVRHGEASSILSSLKRFGEAEIGIGVTVILAAAFSGPFHFSFFEKRPGGLAARPKRLLGHVADPEVLLHRVFAALVAALAVFEWRVQTGRVASATIRLVFPMLIAVSGALLLTHSHSLGDVKEEVLAELSYIPLAILAVMAGWSRWLELRLPAENHTRAWLTRLWPVRISLIGILLLNYREM